MSLWHEFLTNQNRTIWKWTHYLPIYERHFSRFINKSFIFLEIGVFNGGSLQMWKRYFGPFVTIVGIDINPKCKKFEESQIHIRIGDQSDPVFLQSIIDEFGLPDIVLDDGSHIQKHVNATYNFLYEKLNINSVYFIEDLGCAYIAYWGGRLNKKDTFIERCKNFINSFYLEHEISTESTESISVYDSIIALEKKAPNVVGQSSIV